LHLLLIRMNFQHSRPEYDQLYTDFFKAPVWFNQEENSVVFQKDVLSMTHSGQPYLKEVLIQHADRLLKELDASKEFVSAIRKIIIENLHTGGVNIGLVERAMNMSRQTIYRRLKSDNTSFSTLLDDIRRERAVEYLKAKEMTIEEIAFLLGYSETSAFNHAFKRWFGKSVVEYRKNTTGYY
jgi:AraC-like DNA-binding protein